LGQVFTNYMKWCRHLDVRPNFAVAADTAAGVTVGGKPADILLWFFIWGEVR
jgi:hypothetical protein